MLVTTGSYSTITLHGWGEGELVRYFEHSQEGEELPKSDKYGQEGRGSKFWSFCDNVIIECPLCILKVYFTPLNIQNHPNIKNIEVKYF